MSVVFGPAVREDLAEVLVLLEAGGLPTDGLGEHLGGAVVAREAGRVVGVAAVESYGPYALLRSVSVDGEHRGHGLGQRLTDTALELAAGRGAREVFLLTETADGFFRRFGFEPVERSAVPGPVRDSVEFISACPASAGAMVLDLLDTEAR